jgi:cytochrome c oxidase subunit III
MKSAFQNDDNPVAEQKAKRNLVWVITFSITMMFAGFTSAYIVSMGDSFWVKIELPVAFYMSTALIILSSITLWLATRSATKQALSQVRLFVGITLVLGIGFALFQFKGYGQLVDKGAMMNTWIIVNDGRYGDYFEIKKDDKFVDIVNNQYALDGEVLAANELEDLKAFSKKVVNENHKSDLTALNYGSPYQLYYKGEPLSMIQGKLVRANGEPLKPLEFERLTYLAQNIIDNRADFFIKGEMGKDFTLYYKGKPLDYIDRKLYYNGQELSTNLNNKLLRGNKDTSTAYLYIITFLHLLHVLAGIVMLLTLFRKSINGEILKRNALSIKAGSIFWHFLGGLWIYLLLFLVFIH